MAPGGMNGIEQKRKDRTLRRSNGEHLADASAIGGLRLFESALRHKIGQLSVLEFE